MRILALEASTAGEGSWAVMEGEKIIHEEKFSGKTSENLFPSLEKHREKWANVEKILIGVGPGSFSGIRVAIAAAQGMALALGCEIIPVRSSGAVAYQYSDVSCLGVFAQARREEYFITFYERGKLKRPTQLLHTDQLETFLSKCSLAISAEIVAGIEKKAVPQASSLALHYLQYGEEKDLLLEPVHIAK